MMLDFSYAVNPSGAFESTPSPLYSVFEMAAGEMVCWSNYGSIWFSEPDKQKKS
jgi:hypothetical protein